MRGPNADPGHVGRDTRRATPHRALLIRPAQSLRFAALLAPTLAGCFAASTPAATFAPQTERLLEPGVPAIAVAAAGGSELLIAHAGGVAARLALGLTGDKEGQVEGYAAWLQKPVTLTDDEELGHSSGPHLWGGRVGVKGRLKPSICYLAGLGAGGTTDGAFTTAHADAGAIAALPWKVPIYVRGSGGIGIPSGDQHNPVLTMQALGRVGMPLVAGPRASVLFELGAGAMLAVFHTDLGCWGGDCSGPKDEYWLPGFSGIVFAALGAEFGRPGPAVVGVTPPGAAP